jgi:hypothetical protein
MVSDRLTGGAWAPGPVRCLDCEPKARQSNNRIAVWTASSLTLAAMTGMEAVIASEAKQSKLQHRFWMAMKKASGGRVSGAPTPSS